MEISSFRSLAELGIMDDPYFVNQWPINYSLEDLRSESIASLLCEDFQNSLSQQQPMMDFKRAAESPGAGSNIRPLKHLKTTNWDSCKADQNMPNSYFTNPAGMVKPKQETWSSLNTLNFHGTKRMISTSTNTNTNTKLAQAQDHILAERKRREKLSQRFIALSALVPGLKKMDKVSVLGDAVKYLKQLQEKVKILEEQTKKRSMESVVFVKKYQLYADHGENYSSSSDESFSSGPTVTEPLPEIQARFCNKDVLIIINCEKTKGVVEKAIAEIEKLHLSVVNSCVMTFGDSALNITLLAKKDEEFSMNMKDLVKNLRGALKIFI